MKQKLVCEINKTLSFKLLAEVNGYLEAGKSKIIIQNS